MKLPIRIYLRRRITVNHSCPRFQLRMRNANGDMLLNIDSDMIPFLMKFAGYSNFVIQPEREAWTPLMETREFVLEVHE